MNDMAKKELTDYEKDMLSRSALLLGTGMVERLMNTHVIIFGVGGVGSWCAESLVRSGIGHITLVDGDEVCITNCNRQLMATSKTVGRAKVDALRERLLEINPYAEIVALHKVYNEETAQDFGLEGYDYVIDAIDSLKDKMNLILNVTALSKAADEAGRRGPTLFSSMGAALRIDPTKVRVAEFWKVHNDALGAVLRKRMRHAKVSPAKKFLCVYSEEVPMNTNMPKGEGDGCKDEGRGTKYTLGGVKYEGRVNGSLSHVTGVFGFTLAGLVVEKCYNEHKPTTIT